MMERQFENNNAMLKEQREESRAQVEALEEFVNAKAEQPAISLPKKTAVYSR